MIKEKEIKRGIVRGARSRTGRENKRGDYIFLISSNSGDLFNTIFISISLSCFPGADGEAVHAGAPVSPNDAFVGTSALCSKAELQPADPAVYKLTMNRCN